MNKKLLEVAHELAKDLYDVGGIDEQTMREFDVKCLPPVKQYSPLQIKRLRKRSKTSQAVFAAYLNTSPSTIKQWEQGLKKPGGMALKMLHLVDAYGLAIMLV